MHYWSKIVTVANAGDAEMVENGGECPASMMQRWSKTVVSAFVGDAEMVENGGCCKCW